MCVFFKYILADQFQKLIAVFKPLFKNNWCSDVEAAGRKQDCDKDKFAVTSTMFYAHHRRGSTVEVKDMTAVGFCLVG